VITLRPYQLDGIARIRQAFGPDRCRAPLYVLPTGGGKTVIFSHIAYGAQAKGNRVLILTHRIELVDQISGSLANAGVDHGYIAAGYTKRSALTYVANIQTLVRRLGETPAPDLIIIDEAHHARAATWESVIRHWPNAKLLGVTATPMRPSGEGLGTIFDKLIVGPSPAELIAGGWLAPPIVFGPETVDTSGLHTRAGEFVTSESEELVNTPAITGSALEMYRSKTDGLPALAFCVSVQHAHDVAKQFRDAGYSAMALDGGTDREIRRGVVKDFRDRKITLLASCDLFSEGFDCPGVHVGIMLRPTQSEVIYRQQCGRILRPEIGKERAWIFDHCRNWERFGLPHWDRATPWTLNGEDQPKKKKATSVKVCPNCWAAMQSAARKCPECGYLFVPKPREVEQREGKLAEITPEEVARRQEKRRLAFEQSKATTPEQLAEIFRHRGYKGDLLGRARHVLAARAAKKSA